MESGDVNRDQALKPGGAFATGQEDQRNYKARVEWAGDINRRLCEADWTPRGISMFYEPFRPMEEPAEPVRRAA